MDGSEILAAVKGRFPVRRAVVCGRLGLSKADERGCRLRYLEQGVDFEEVGHEVRYSDAGLEKLAGLLGLDSQKKRAAVSRGDRGAALAGGEGEDSPEGFRAFLEAVGQKNGASKKGRLLLTEVAGTWAPRQVTVYRADFLNRQVIECCVAGAVERVTVRVRSSEHFIAGMVIWARPEMGQSAWVFMGGGPTAVEGARCPRFRGKF